MDASRDDGDREAAEKTVREYYEALREGAPLAAFFLEDDATTKFGVSEALYGYEAVASGLREQSETTGEWRVESDRLAVDVRGDCAVVTDRVTLAWTDQSTGIRRRFETRWSGTLVREEDSDAWLFHTLHVSAPNEL
ncbi:nuclear transport factor 2 family protein [Halobacteria archaeon AArc-dxtr1]|nr:nuclear transport factor 2 family protein [Halobacteria archaeon AArc-dxtr1]